MAAMDREALNQQTVQFEVLTGCEKTAEYRCGHRDTEQTDGIF
jgi:hypothetical protein